MNKICIKFIYPEDLKGTYVSATSIGGWVYRIDAKSALKRSADIQWSLTKKL